MVELSSEWQGRATIQRLSNKTTKQPLLQGNCESKEAFVNFYFQLIFKQKFPFKMYSPLFVNFWTRSEGLWNKYINSVGCPWDGRAIWRLLILPDTEEEELGEGTLSVIFAFMCLPYPISNLNNFIFPKLSSIKGFHSFKQTTITYWVISM